MAAKETELGSLHEVLTKKYKAMLKKPEECTPALLSSAAKFLKDNGVVCEAGDPDMDALKDKLEETSKFPFDPNQDESVTSTH